MTLPNLDELDRVRFVWPEPLVIELICDQYAGRIPQTQQMAFAKLHEHMLRGMVESQDHQSALRRQVLAQCGACGLDDDSIARIDQAVVFELIRLVGMRFRNSPRLREAYSQRLQAALAEITMAIRPVTSKPAVPRAAARPMSKPVAKIFPLGPWRPRNVAA